LNLPKEEGYVRRVETVLVSGGKPFTIIVCMLPSMSELLPETKRFTIDTSFKRAHGYEEFEIEGYFPFSMKCK